MKKFFETPTVEIIYCEEEIVRTSGWQEDVGEDAKNVNDGNFYNGKYDF